MLYRKDSIERKKQEGVRECLFIDSSLWVVNLCEVGLVETASGNVRASQSRGRAA